MVINFNLDALNARNQERLHGLGTNKFVERLSNGLKINRGADDPSGLGIAATAKAQVRGISTALQNVQDSINLYNLRDSYFEQIEQMMNRMRDLAVRASNDATLTQSDLTKMDGEVQKLKNEINRMGPASYKVDGGRLLFNPGDLDVIWVMDITGSMDPYATSLFNDSAAMFDQFKNNGFDLQMGVVGFDHQVEHYTDSQSFQTTAAGFKNDVQILKNQITGHLSGTEYGMKAIDTALSMGSLGGSLRPTAQHVVILLTDEDSDDFYASTPTGESSYFDNLPVGYPTVMPPPPPLVGPFETPNDATAAPDPTNIRQTTINNLAAANAKLNAVGVVKEASIIWGYNPFSGNWLELAQTAPYFKSHLPDQDYSDVATASGGSSFELDTGGSWVSSITGAMMADGEPWDADFQVGPDSGNILTGNFESISTSQLGIGGVNLSSVTSAQNSINFLDNGKSTLADVRTNTAQIVKRLGHIANDLSNEMINVSAYKSNIEDADVASEIVSMTANQMLNQTTIAAEAQADVNPKQAMQLVDVIRNTQQVGEYNPAFYNKNA